MTMRWEIFENANRFLERMQEKNPYLRSLGLGERTHRIIHRDNKAVVRLYEAPTQLRSTTPVLMIPSLINRPYILDLLPGKSLVEFLTHRGHQVAMLDWGTPGDEDRDVPLDRYMDDYLRRSIRAVLRETGARQVLLLGYCLGGTMALSHAAAHPESVAGLILLTAPINFHNSGLLSAWCQTPTYDVDAMVEAHGNVPWALMQSTFQCLRPTMSATRAMGFLKRLWDDEFISGFAALEIWANDNISFPGRCYKEFIQSFYQGNCLMHDGLRMSGRPVRLKSLTHPILNVAADGDHIVPLDATAPLRSLVGSRDFTDHIAPGGHIGAIVSKKASSGLWLKMSDWIESRFPICADFARPAEQIEAIVRGTQSRLVTSQLPH